MGPTRNKPLRTSHKTQRCQNPSQMEKQPQRNIEKNLTSIRNPTKILQIYRRFFIKQTMTITRLYS